MSRQIGEQTDSAQTDRRDRASYTGRGRAKRSHKRDDSARDRPGGVGQLRGLVGNQQVQRLVREGHVQRTAVVGDPGDRYEQEADQLAEQVLRDPGSTSGREPEPDGSPPQVQTATSSSDSGIARAGGGGTGDSGSKRSLRPAGRESSTVERKPSTAGKNRSSNDGSQSTSTSSVVERVLGHSGRPLDRDTRSDMEARFGHNFSSVRVHTDSRAAESARALGADAYTVGEHIAFDAGQHRPHTAAGRRLLAHELVHVIQQGGGKRLIGSGEGYEQSGDDADLTAVNAVQPTPVNGPLVQRNENEELESMSGGLNPSCVGLLNMSGGSTAGLGREVQKRIENHFGSQVGPSEGFAIPGGTADPLRTEGRPGDETFIKPEVFDPIDPHPLKGTGIPDIAYKNGTVMELIEVKPANWASLVFAEEQIARYVRHGNAEYNEALRSRLGVTRFERMPTSRYRPPRRLSINGRTVFVTWCGPGIILYKPKKKKKKRRRRPIREPVWEPFAILAGAIALKLISETIKQLNPGRKVKAALAAVAAIVLLSSSTASAQFKPGAEGQDPIVALFEMMAANGTPAPPELRERIENNPALRKKLEKSLRSGDLTAAQKALNEDMIKLIGENEEEFTDEELEALLTASELASGDLPQSAKTVSELQAALQRRGAGGPGGGAGSEGAPSSEQPAPKRVPPEPTPGEERTPAEPEAHEKTPSERWISDAPPPVKRLFDEMVKRGTGGPRVTTEVARRFREALPELTAAEADQLIDRIQPAEGQTVDAILTQLSAALRTIRQEGKEKPETPDVRREGPAGDVADPVETRPAEAAEDYVARMRRAINEFPDWEKIPSGQPLYVVADKSVLNLPVGNTFSATVFFKFEPEGESIVRGMGVATLQVTTDNADPPRESVRSTSVGELVLVYENGNIVRVPITKQPRELTIAPLTFGGQ